jgi:lysophospholipase-2
MVPEGALKEEEVINIGDERHHKSYELTKQVPWEEHHMRSATLLSKCIDLRTNPQILLVLTFDLTPHFSILLSTTADQMDRAETQPDQETKNRSFGPVHIIEPNSDHTHTAIMLHGRGSNGKEFAEELLASTLSDDCSLYEKLPGCRWVFPSSQELWSTAFQEDMPAWFEAHSLTDITARQDLQVSGIRDSVDHIIGIINEEVKRLDGNPQRLVLGGISQGGAVALWTLLCQRKSAMKPGVVVVTSTWLPFAPSIEHVFAGQHDFDKPQEAEFDSFVEQMMAVETILGMSDVNQDSCRMPPVFIGHGVDDAYLDLELGRQAVRILSQAGLPVEWKEYSGAEGEGHWFKVPDEMDDIYRFLARIEWIG